MNPEIAKELDSYPHLAYAHLIRRHKIDYAKEPCFFYIFDMYAIQRHP